MGTEPPRHPQGTLLLRDVLWTERVLTVPPPLPLPPPSASPKALQSATGSEKTCKLEENKRVSAHSGKLRKQTRNDVLSMKFILRNRWVHYIRTDISFINYSFSEWILYSFRDISRPKPHLSNLTILNHLFLSRLLV